MAVPAEKVEWALKVSSQVLYGQVKLTGRKPRNTVVKTSSPFAEILPTARQPGNQPLVDSTTLWIS